VAMGDSFWRKRRCSVTVVILCMGNLVYGISGKRKKLSTDIA
jgi:hypothetical protein